MQESSCNLQYARSAAQEEAIEWQTVSEDQRPGGGTWLMLRWRAVQRSYA
jgi:hypothetical protein